MFTCSDAELKTLKAIKPNDFDVTKLNDVPTTVLHNIMKLTFMLEDKSTVNPLFPQTLSKPCDVSKKAADVKQPENLSDEEKARREQELMEQRLHDDIDRVLRDEDDDVMVVDVTAHDHNADKRVTSADSSGPHMTPRRTQPTESRSHEVRSSAAGRYSSDIIPYVHNILIVHCACIHVHVQLHECVTVGSEPAQPGQRQGQEETVDC